MPPGRSQIKFHDAVRVYMVVDGCDSQRVRPVLAFVEGGVLQSIVHFAGRGQRYRLIEPQLLGLQQDSSLTLVWLKRLALFDAQSL